MNTCLGFSNDAEADCKSDYSLKQSSNFEGCGSCVLSTWLVGGDSQTIDRDKSSLAASFGL